MTQIYFFLEYREARKKLREENRRNSYFPDYSDRSFINRHPRPRLLCPPQANKNRHLPSIEAGEPTKQLLESVTKTKQHDLQINNIDKLLFANRKLSKTQSRACIT